MMQVHVSFKQMLYHHLSIQQMENWAVKQMLYGCFEKKKKNVLRKHKNIRDCASIVLGSDSSPLLDQISRCSKAMNTSTHAIIVNCEEPTENYHRS